MRRQLILAPILLCSLDSSCHVEAWLKRGPLHSSTYSSTGAGSTSTIAKTRRTGREPSSPCHPQRRLAPFDSISRLSATPNDKDRRSEIEALGGDPFFFSGGDHDDLDDETSKDDEEPELSAESIMALMAMSASGGDDGTSGGSTGAEGVLGLINQRSQKSASQPEPDELPPSSSSLEEDMAEIAAMGGDPSFLLPDVPESVSEISPSSSSSLEEDMEEIAAMGGDPTFLLPDEPEPTSAPKSEIPPSSSSVEEAMEEIAAIGGDPTFLLPDEPETKPEMPPSSSSSLEEDMEKIAAMGGDPSFLFPDESAPALKSENSISPSSSSLEEDMKEIAEMGGDPSFLLPDEPEPKPEISVSSSSLEEDMAEIAAMGGDPSFLLPAETESKNNIENDKSNQRNMPSQVNEDLFLTTDGNDAGENNIPEDKEPEISPEAFLQLATMAGASSGSSSPVMDLIQPPVSGRTPFSDDTASSIKPPMSDDSENYDMEAAVADIEAMGGDPSFIIVDDEDDDEADNYLNTATAVLEDLKRFALSDRSGGGRGQIQDPLQEEEDDDDDGHFEWDGIVDEEAHLGF